MSYMEQKVGLNILKIDEHNPRFPPVSSQEEAIDQMLAEIPEKVIAIARDIARNKLNPTVKPAVFVNQMGEYIVKDGNRRITAIKILFNPKLVKDEKLKRRFEKLTTVMNRPALRYISCVVFDNENEVDHWVEVNHLNDNTGVGHEDWSALAKMRAEKERGKNISEYELYVLIDPKSLKINDDDFSITTFGRIVKSKAFKDLTGWKCENNQMFSDVPKDEFIKGLSEIALDIYNPKRPDHVNSRAMNGKVEIEKYLDKKKQQGLFPKGQPSVIGPIGSLPARNRKSSPRRKRRTTVNLIPKENWTTGYPRIDDLLTELQTLSLEAHPNAVAVLFRAYIEILSQWFADQNDIQKIHLDQRLSAMADFLYLKGKLSDDAKRSVKVTVANKDDVINFCEELNQFGHNYVLNPAPGALINVFNSISPLLKAVYTYEDNPEPSKKE